jgi:hypothetical protein
MYICIRTYVFILIQDTQYLQGLSTYSKGDDTEIKKLESLYQLKGIYIYIYIYIYIQICIFVQYFACIHRK